MDVAACFIRGFARFRPYSSQLQSGLHKVRRSGTPGRSSSSLFSETNERGFLDSPSQGIIHRYRGSATAEQLPCDLQMCLSSLEG